MQIALGIFAAANVHISPPLALFVLCMYPRKYTPYRWKLDDSVLGKFRVILDDVASSHCHFPRCNVFSPFFLLSSFSRGIYQLYISIVRTLREFTSGKSARKTVSLLADAPLLRRAHRPYLCTHTWVACRNKSSLARHLAFLR